jgi:hypothetical protein
MSAYIYAIIPYKSGIHFSKEDKEQGWWNPFISELKNVSNEFTEEDRLILFEDFLMVNTCYRQSAFTGCKDGYNWIRAGIYEIAKAIGANEVWYVEELITDYMADAYFSFAQWIETLRIEKSHLVAELNLDVLAGNSVYSYYHDDFSDIIMEKPQKEKYPKKGENK